MPLHALLPTIHAFLLSLAGLAADVIPNLKKDFGVAIVDLMFLDHSAATYVSDVDVASAQNFLATGA